MHRREALSLSLRQNSIVRVCGSTIRTRNPKLRIIFLWKLIWTVPKIWITRQRNAIDTKSSAPSNLNLLTQNPTEYATARIFVNREEEQDSSSSFPSPCPSVRDTKHSVSSFRLSYRRKSQHAVNGGPRSLPHVQKEVRGFVLDS
jgi:hypothetical protein